jgi:hypothetical protein
MNNYAKMRRVQRLAREYLEADYWKVHLTPHTRYQKDIFGLFDMVCVSEVYPFVLWVQVKSGYCKKGPFIKWSKDYGKTVQVMERLSGRWRVSAWDCGVKAAGCGIGWRGNNAPRKDKGRDT